jgi:hypothetical protein
MIIAGLSNPKYIAGQQLNRIPVTVTERQHFLKCVDILEQHDSSTSIPQRENWWGFETFVESSINELTVEHKRYHNLDKGKVAKLIQAKAVAKLQSAGLLPAGILVILKLAFFNLMKRLILNWILDQLTEANDTGKFYVQHVQSAPPEPQPDLAGSK